MHRIFLAYTTGLSRSFQFPLLGFLLCIATRASKQCPRIRGLSIPFIGIFALHRNHSKGRGWKARRAFNSLYWDFCFASGEWLYHKAFKRDFQFPLLGFLLCIHIIHTIHVWRRCDFQFPLLGFLLCIPAKVDSLPFSRAALSIPFIGIFALHRVHTFLKHRIMDRFQFPLLGFLLCI